MLRSNLSTNGEHPADSPLHHNPPTADPVTTFRDYDLSSTSLQALDAMKIETPTPIQAATIPPLLEGRDVIGQAATGSGKTLAFGLTNNIAPLNEGRDVIGQAATGSGKTLAFGLPLVQHADPSDKVPRALVVVPTRELAQQVGGVLEQLVQRSRVRVAVLYGGRALGPQQDALRKGIQIVVGTPGRLVDLLTRRSLRLDGIRYLVLDEADEMLDRGFAQDVEHLLSATPRERQTSLFSATTPEWVHRISAKYLRDPEVVELAMEDDATPDIDHVVYEVWREDKFAVLRRLLDEQTDGSTLVFGRTKHGVQRLGQRLARLGYKLGVLQGNLGQQQRDRVLHAFRSGKTPLLLATNVAARGLDVLHIDRVINYDLPETHDLFTHRVGRTGRMGRSGRAITLLGPADLPKWHEIERGLGRKLPRMTADGKPIATPPSPKKSRNGRRSGWRRMRVR